MTRAKYAKKMADGGLTEEEMNRGLHRAESQGPAFGGFFDRFKKRSEPAPVEDRTPTPVKRDEPAKEASNEEVEAFLPKDEPDFDKSAPRVSKSTAKRKAHAPVKAAEPSYPDRADTLSRSDKAPEAPRKKGMYERGFEADAAAFKAWRASTPMGDEIQQRLNKQRSAASQSKSRQAVQMADGGRVAPKYGKK